MEAYNDFTVFLGFHLTNSMYVDKLYVSIISDMQLCLQKNSDDKIRIFIFFLRYSTKSKIVTSAMFLIQSIGFSTLYFLYADHQYQNVQI